MSISTRDSVCYGHAGIIEDAGTAGAISVGTTFDYTINGVAYTRTGAATDVALSGTTLSDKQQCVFWVWVDSAGTCSVTQSAIVSAITNTSTPLVAGVWEWPQSTTKCCIGAVRVKNVTGSDWIPGTDDLGEASVIDTYYHVVGDYSVPVPYDMAAA